MKVDKVYNENYVKFHERKNHFEKLFSKWLMYNGQTQWNWQLIDVCGGR